MGIAASNTSPLSWPLGMSYNASNPQPLNELKEAGIQCIELTWQGLDIFDPEVRNRCGDIIRNARSMGISVWSAHIPYGDEWDPSILDDAAREKVLEDIAKVLGYAQQWGISKCILHPSFEPVPEEYRAARLEQARNSIRSLSPVAQHCGVELAIECLPRTCLGNTSEEIAFIIGEDLPYIGVCVDVNHLFKESPEHFIQKLGHRIITTHISDNDGVDERHLVPGLGILNFTAIIQALSEAKYEGAFLYETRITPPEVITDNWRKLLNEAGIDRSAANKLATPPWPIAGMEQATGKVLVLDPAADDWNDESAVLWSWSPPEASGLNGGEVGWGYVTDARLKHSKHYGGECFVVCASHGYAGLIRYPDTEQVIWSRRVGGNPHAIELLPDGNVAVAASEGQWVRVYALGHGQHSDVYAEYPLTTAHGVLWDSEYNWLWVIGHDYLTALRVTGTPDAPGLEEVLEQRSTLPTPDGHDLSPVYGDADRLWVTTSYDIYSYVKSQHRFEEVARAEGEYRTQVKSLVNDPSGERMVIVPDEKRTPKGACAALNGWSTERIDFYPSNVSKSRKGAAFYKARYWHLDYDGWR